MPPPRATPAPVCQHESAAKGKELQTFVNRSQRKLDIFLASAFCRNCLKYHLTFIYSLTEKDIRLLRLLAFGMHYEEISKRMQVSKSTWYRHANRIQDMTGAKSRTHLVAVAIHIGAVNLLSEPEIT